MRAVILDHERREVLERDVPEPRPEHPDDVLFRVREVGICGTDRELAAFHYGHGPAGEHFLIPGHEAVGEVASGAGFAPGDIVVPMVRRACQPPCASCARGRRDLCLSGKYSERGIIGAHGYFTALAVDRAQDLVRIPREAADFAVLIEPLSVVEKAVALALRLHLAEPATALVLGAGSIGLLAAAVLRLRGFDVDLVSVEPPDAERPRLARLAGANYGTRTVRQYDIVMEAAGVPEAVHAGFASLAAVGVLVVLGANESVGPLPFLDFLVGNKIVAGSVNAGPQAFAEAVRDLPMLPRALLSGMISRRDFGDYRRSFLGDPGAEPKIVHAVAL